MFGIGCGALGLLCKSSTLTLLTHEKFDCTKFLHVLERAYFTLWHNLHLGFDGEFYRTHIRLIVKVTGNYRELVF